MGTLKPADRSPPNASDVSIQTCAGSELQWWKRLYMNISSKSGCRFERKKADDNAFWRFLLLSWTAYFYRHGTCSSVRRSAMSTTEQYKQKGGKPVASIDFEAAGATRRLDSGTQYRWHYELSYPTSLHIRSMSIALSASRDLCR